MPKHKDSKSSHRADKGGNPAPKKSHSKGGSIAPQKARKILKDGKIGGKPLTQKQKGLFGSAAGKASRKKK